MYRVWLPMYAYYTYNRAHIRGWILRKRTYLLLYISLQYLSNCCTYYKICIVDRLHIILNVIYFVGVIVHEDIYDFVFAIQNIYVRTRKYENKIFKVYKNIYEFIFAIKVCMSSKFI